MVRDLLQLNTLYKRLFIGCSVALLVLAGMYGFFLKQTIASVVERRLLEHERAELAARVSTLEARYIAIGESVTIARAHELGFVNVTEPHFVSRAPHAFSFNYTGNTSDDE